MAWNARDKLYGFHPHEINRVKEIEDNQGRVSVSEGIDSNYMDIINYAVFGLIKTKGAE